MDTSVYSLDDRGMYFKVTYVPTGANFGITLQAKDMSQSPQSIIQEIYVYRIINPDTDPPTIPDLYADLGNPEMVRLMSGVENEQVVLLYQGQQTLVFLDDLDCDRIPLKQEITQITLIDPQKTPHFAWLSDPQMWQGFGRCYNFIRKLFP
ncbi:MAG: hypothetical protein H0X30_30775 [Anaerolineae bacterium]|nr:hypothetical protein [Anaerolineae bacterium]